MAPAPVPEPAELPASSPEDGAVKRSSGASRPSSALTNARTGDDLALECKGIRSTSDFPRDLKGLSPEQIAHHYSALRNSHAAISRSRGQLQRRSRELSELREQFLATLRRHEERLLLIGQEKAEAMRLAEEMHRELQAFERTKHEMDSLLSDFDAVKQEAGFWSIFQLNQLMDRLRGLLRGGQRGDG